MGQFLGCVDRYRKMRDDVSLAHLHPVFRKAVPPKAGLRYKIVMWLSHRLSEKEPPSLT